MILILYIHWYFTTNLSKMTSREISWNISAFTNMVDFRIQEYIEEPSGQLISWCWFIHPYFFLSSLLWLQSASHICKWLQSELKLPQWWKTLDRFPGHRRLEAVEIWEMRWCNRLFGLFKHFWEMQLITDLQGCGEAERQKKWKWILKVGYNTLLWVNSFKYTTLIMSYLQGLLLLDVLLKWTVY